MQVALNDSSSAVRVLELEPGIDYCSAEVRHDALEILEGGGVVVLPQSGFELTPPEQALIDDTRALLVKQPKTRNGRPTLLFDPVRGKLLKRPTVVGGEIAWRQVRRSACAPLEALLARFGAWADDLIGQLLPSYQAALVRDRITYRPNAREGKQALHIDSVYGFPTRGRGWLRIFCNVDPQDRPRIWRVGEPFEPFATRYLPAVKVRRILPGLSLGGRKPGYDRLIAELRRLGKCDAAYQRDAPQRMVTFPRGACWIAFTDLVLHGAVSGQHSIDQSYFLPAPAMHDPARSSLRILERLTQRSLA